MSAYSPRCVYLFRLETKGIRGESNLGQVAIDGLFISDNQISLSETTSRKNSASLVIDLIYPNRLAGGAPGCFNIRDPPAAQRSRQDDKIGRLPSADPSLRLRSRRVVERFRIARSINLRQCRSIDKRRAYRRRNTIVPCRCQGRSA